MGDVAMMVPVLSALKKQYPNLRITVLTKAFNAPMFARLSNITVHVADVKHKHKGIWGLWKLFKELRGLHIDAVADLHHVLRSNLLKLYFKGYGTPFYQIDKGRKGKKALTRKRNKVFKPLKSTHQRYAEVFGKLGFPVNLSKAVTLQKEKLSDTCRKLVGTESKKWLGLAPFAAFRGKMYPLPLMETVIAELQNTKNYKIILFGGGAQEGEQLESWQNKFENCINIVGKLSFPEELAIISNLECMLSMDSGNGHLAAMYGVPVITIWGITHPYAGFSAFGQSAENHLTADRTKYPLIPTSVYGNKCPDGYQEAIASTSPKMIVKKLVEVLA